MIRKWRMWRAKTDLSNSLFLKMYIYDNIIVRPKRKANRIRQWILNLR